MNKTKMIGLKINSNKIKYMQITRQPNNKNNFKIGNYKFQVKEFQYLRTIFNNICSYEEEIQHHLVNGNKCYYSLQK